MAELREVAAQQSAHDPRRMLPLESAHPQATAPLPPLGKGETLDVLLDGRVDPAFPGFVNYGSLRVEASLASGYLRGFQDKNRRFDTAEEQRNENTMERPAALALGEGTRTDHGGTPYRVADPTSRAPVEAARTYTPQQLQSAITDRIANLQYHGYVTPALPLDAKAIVPWDHRAHEGFFLEIDQHTVVQHVGRGRYQVFDVEKDLGGTFPDQTRVSSVDSRGHVSDARTATHHLDHQPGLAR